MSIYPINCINELIDTVNKISVNKVSIKAWLRKHFGRKRFWMFAMLWSTFCAGIRRAAYNGAAAVSRAQSHTRRHTATVSIHSNTHLLLN